MIHSAHNPGGERGFTLLELIIYIALLATVVVAAAMIALQFTITQAKAAVYAQASRNAQFAMSRIESEVREADSITVGSSVFGSNPGTLTLATSVPANSPTIFTVTNGQLTVKQGAGAAIPLTEPDVTVTEFTLENLSPNARTQNIRIHIKVSLPTSTANTDIQTTVQLDSTVRIRRSEGFTLLWPASSLTRRL
jgi:prepilin-type N-terminal cleavage/methylation domain-containing protein